MYSKYQHANAENKKKLGKFVRIYVKAHPKRLVFFLFPVLFLFCWGLYYKVFSSVIYLSAFVIANHLLLV
jgi:hypothetical protein